MSNTLLSILFFLVIIIIAFAYYYWMVSKREEEEVLTKDAFSIIAKQHKLTLSTINKNTKTKFSKATPYANGQIDDWPFQLYMYRDKDMNVDNDFTEFCFKCKDERLVFNIYQEVIWTKLQKVIDDIQDIQIGIDDFDDKFIIQADQESTAKNILDKDIRQTLVDNYDSFDGRFTLLNGNLTYTINDELNEDKRTEKFLKMISIGKMIVQKIEEIK